MHLHESLSAASVSVLPVLCASEPVFAQPGLVAVALKRRAKKMRRSAAHESSE
jgi:hypothetical protein